MFLLSLQFTLKWEGGLSDHPNDHGGLTYRGVTQDTCNQWCQLTGQRYRSCASLLQTDIERIYKDMYWDRVKGDSLPWPLSLAVFDCAVHSGPSRSIKLLQRACGIVEDGIIGPVTLASAGVIDPLKVVETRRAFLKYLIEKDPSQEDFRDGWMNRLDDLAKLLRSSTNSHGAMKVSSK